MYINPIFVSFKLVVNYLYIIKHWSIKPLFVKFPTLIPLALREVQVVRYHPILHQCSYFFACFHATYKKHQHSSIYTFNGPLNSGHLYFLYLCFQAKQKMSFNKSKLLRSFLRLKEFIFNVQRSRHRKGSEMVNRPTVWR